MAKLTEAQRAFLRQHQADAFLRKYQAHKTYDFVGRLRDMGLIEIHDGDRTGWPWSWEGTTLTEAGLDALNTGGAGHE